VLERKANTIDKIIGYCVFEQRSLRFPVNG
jgi:hypothetical protein